MSSAIWRPHSPQFSSGPLGNRDIRALYQALVATADEQNLQPGGLSSSNAYRPYGQTLERKGGLVKRSAG